jgi:hypothetical protein
MARSVLGMLKLWALMGPLEWRVGWIDYSKINFIEVECECINLITWS